MKFQPHIRRKRSLSDWGLSTESNGIICVGGCQTLDIAAKFGTPLHVVNEERLAITATTFVKAFTASYSGKVSVHFAFKCNPIPGVISIIKSRGLKAEVMSGFELTLAFKLGFTGSDIIVNGPYKPDDFLCSCILSDVRFIIVDSIEELLRLNKLSGLLNKKSAVLLRINPDYIPKGMNRGTSTGDRKGCAFGIDLKGGEVEKALNLISSLEHIYFSGFHFHIGTGINDPKDYYKALTSIKPIINYSFSLGYIVSVLDIGGGFASDTTREMTTMEMLWYQITNRFPLTGSGIKSVGFSDFANTITSAIFRVFNGEYWPELILEPGRSIASPNQMLLIEVNSVKERKGIRKWLITNGGIGTVSMPTFYEIHEILLCNDAYRPACEYTTINGPGCFSADVVYNGKFMPKINAGEILAIMDSGAYFTSWESNFGHQRPAVIGVKNGVARIFRHRETYEDMFRRDEFDI
jgi:diaminopimelate decarboxylase